MERIHGNGFGETLRRAREAAELTVEQLAEATRVQARYVHALEAEDWDSVPPGVIGRGFVRLLAKRLGTAGEALPALYAAARPEEPAVLHTPPGQTFPVALRHILQQTVDLVSRRGFGEWLDADEVERYKARHREANLRSHEECVYHKILTDVYADADFVVRNCARWSVRPGDSGPAIAE